LNIYSNNFFQEHSFSYFSTIEIKCISNHTNREEDILVFVPSGYLFNATKTFVS